MQQNGYVYMLSVIRFDYSVPWDRANQFYPEIRKYYPYLRDGSLEPGYAGVRSKLSGAMQGPVDFTVQVMVIQILFIYSVLE